MKFKVGDEVRVVRDESVNYPYLIGRVGIITGVSNSYERYPYMVDGAGKRFAAAESELELIADAALTGFGGVAVYNSNSCDTATKPREIGYLALTEALQGDNPYVHPKVDDEAMSVWIDLNRFCKEG